jgi:multicomponent Na+:H+ antiporter subunit G
VTSLMNIGAVITLIGTLICMVGAVGLIRLPNFFARTHAGGVTDTLGAGLTIFGLILIGIGFDAPFDYRVLVIIKLVSIAVLLLVTGPISGHALTRSALENGVGMESIPLSVVRQTRWKNDIPNLVLSGDVEEQQRQLNGCILSVEWYSTLTEGERNTLGYLRPPFSAERFAQYETDYRSILDSRSVFATTDFLIEPLGVEVTLLKAVANEKRNLLQSRGAE